MTDKTMTFRIGDDHEDVMKETLTEVFDALQWKNVVGTLSGDDTFLIVARSERDAKTICSELTRYVGQR